MGSRSIGEKKRVDTCEEKRRVSSLKNQGKVTIFRGIKKLFHKKTEKGETGKGKGQGVRTKIRGEEGQR